MPQNKRFNMDRFFFFFILFVLFSRARTAHFSSQMRQPERASRRWTWGDPGESQIFCHALQEGYGSHPPSL